MISENGVHVVKASHNFKGSNNDELCFKKGDIITVTQSLEGGWWEGTLNGVTGWFPSNYVKEMKQDSQKVQKHAVQPQDGPTSPKLDSMKMYRGIVFKDIVDTEGNHLNELRTLIKSYVVPLKDSEMMSEDEYQLLKGNIEDVCACNVTLLSALEEVQEQSPKDQKIGGIFMQIAPHMKRVNLVYCANHPKAVSIIEKYKNELEKFLESRGAPSPGILTLTTGLSSPFRRLEKYPALLQELQRHTEENHVDRGDTQRAIFVFRDIAAACLNIRRQKENELEVMSGNIRGWEGEDIQSLGEIIHMGLVLFLSEDQERKDRYLVVFSQTLVILSVSPRISAFIYEGKLPLSGVIVTKLDESEHGQPAFEITGDMIQKIVVLCVNQESQDQWLSVLHAHVHSNNVSTSSKGSTQSSPTHPIQSLASSCSSAQTSQQQQSHQTLQQSHQTLQQSPIQQQTTLIEDKNSQQTNSRVTSTNHVNNKIWSSWSLRPHPPRRPSLNNIGAKGEVVLRRSNSRRREKVPDEKNYEGDMKILQVIEAYCTSEKTRYTVNSVYVDAPQLFIAENEKIIMDHFDVPSTTVEEKTLVDTVYTLKDQIQELNTKTSQLFKNLDEEKEARHKLELLLQKHVLGGCDTVMSTYFDD